MLYTFDHTMQDGKSGLILASEAGHELVMFNLLDREAEVDFKLEVIPIAIRKHINICC